MPELPRIQPPPWTYRITGSDPLAPNRLEKPYLHVADLGGHGDPFVFPDLDLVDRSGLKVVEHLACGLGSDLVQEGRIGGGVGYCLRGGFEHNLCHDWFLSVLGGRRAILLLPDVVVAGSHRAGQELVVHRDRAPAEMARS